jgi:lipid-A-disaccharide synthase
MKYYIIAGEASGDLHGSNLIKELKKNDPQAEIRCWGGDKMKDAGGELVKHYRELAFMGFAEVIMNLGTIFRNLKFCKEDILAFQPDALILVDYPGFNLRIAKWAKQQQLFGSDKRKIIYYISPQVWAWKEGRVRMMKQCIDKMLVILPFEKDYYKNKWDWEVEYVGHPLIDVITRHKEQGTRSKVQGTRDKEQGTSDKLSDKKIIALLPGSRKQEILKKLPIMLEVSRNFPDYQFVVAKAPGLDEDFYNGLLRPYSNVSFVSNQTYDLLSQSKAALVTSGTATLETALFAVPEVVCYKGSWLSYQIGRRLVKVKFISLVNLIMDRLVVHELIQDQLTVDNLQKELESLLNDPARKEQLQKDYLALWQKLYTGESASAKAAYAISSLLRPAT